MILSIIPISHALSANSLKKQMSLGQKYLEELDYEQAVASFIAVIEIDDRNVEAYLGLAEAYMGLGQTDEAIATLEKGIALTDDESLKAYLQAIQDELAAQAAAEAANKEVISAEAEEDEDGQAWVSVILEYRDGSHSEPITDIPMNYTLSADEAQTIRDFYKLPYDASENDWFERCNEVIAPFMVCAFCDYSPCIYLDEIIGSRLNAEDPASTYTNTTALLMYCPECQKVSSISYIDPQVPYDPVTKGPAY